MYVFHWVICFFATPYDIFANIDPGQLVTASIFGEIRGFTTGHPEAQAGHPRRPTYVLPKLGSFVDSGQIARVDKV